MMATYTMQLQELIKTGADLGMREYKIHDESYRHVLNKRIIDHYKYEEIAFESPDVFIDRLNMRLNEIMPYYAQLYETTLIKYDPLVSQRFTSSGQSETEMASQAKGSGSNTTDADTISNTYAKSLNSDYPQTEIDPNGVYGTSSTATETHGTSGSKATASNEDESHSTGKTGTVNKTVSEGFTQSPSLLIEAKRRAIINVDIMIIDELASLFFGLWDLGDSVTANYYHPFNNPSL